MFEYIHFYLVTVLFFVLVQQNCSVSRNYRPPEKKPHIDEDLNVKRVSELVSDNSYLKEVLDHIVVPRVVGTANHSAVIKYITNELHNLGWDVEIDNFMDRTPLGMKSFNNIITTPNKYATQYLDLACHLDSKKYDDIVFYGATDSAVPCAMMMQIARSFNEYLKKSKNKDLSLRLIFFDGEEAFVRWSPTDSIYGARHLAEHWASTPATELGPGFNQLHRMDLLVLLDLLGTPNPNFYNFFSETLDAYRMLVHAQSKLKEKGMIHPYAKYFHKKSTIDRIEDDHLPFIQRGVPVVHIIPVPFPRQWHTEYDNYDAIDFPTVNNLVKILSLFVVDYLGLELYP